MLKLIIIYFIAGVSLAFLIAPIAITALRRYGIIRVNSRNIQANDTKSGKPIMGGLIFIIPIFILGVIANYTVQSSISNNINSFIYSGSIKIVLLTFGISALLGGIDDILNIYGTERPIRSFKRMLRLIFIHKSIIERIKLILLLPWNAYKSFFFILGSHPGKGIQAHEKIIVQFIVGLILSWWVYFYLGFEYLWIPYIGNIFLGIFMIPLIILTLILTTNAVNITDGMDGLSSGISIIALSGFLLVSSISSKNEPIAIMCAISIGALITYLFFNAKPALVEMGDTGSLALGTLLASIAFSTNRPILLIFFCGVFYLELLSSVIQGLGRRILGRRIFKMAPLHHHFEMKGMSEEKIVVSFWIMAMIFFMGGLWFIL